MHVSIYLAGTAILSIFCVVDLILDEWFKYCYWDIGLIKGSQNFDYFDGESTIKDIHSDACDDSDLKDYLQDMCPDLCDNLSNAELSGGFMITFCVLTMIALIFVFLLHALLLCKKRINARFMWLLMFVPILCWLGGFVIYTAVIGTNNIRGTKNPPKSPGKYYYYFDGHNPKDFEMKGGMIFAIIIIIFMAFHLVHGMIFTRKYF